VTRLAIRAGLVVVAAALIGWLLVSLHYSNLQSSGENTLERMQRGPVTNAAVVRAIGDFKDAARHTSDPTPDIDLGFLLQGTGHSGEAFGLGLRAVKAEPDNVQGWALVYVSAPNAAAAQRPRAEVRRLNPWLGDSLPRR
jgi:hypothetical protein